MYKQLAITSHGKKQDMKGESFGGGGKKSEIDETKILAETIYPNVHVYSVCKTLNIET